MMDNKVIQDTLHGILQLTDTTSEVLQTYSEDDVKAIGIILFKLCLTPPYASLPAELVLRTAASSWFMEIKDAQP